MNWVSRIGHGFANLLAGGPAPQEYKLGEARAAIAGAKPEIIDLGLGLARETAKTAEETGSSVEGKAHNLVGFAAVLSGLGVGLLTLAASKDNGISSVGVRAWVLGGFAIGTILLVVSIVRAYQVVRIGLKRKTIFVSAETPLEFVGMKANDAKKEWIASLVCASTNNFRVAQWKADVLRRAQFWLLLAIAVTVCTSIFALTVLISQSL